MIINGKIIAIAGSIIISGLITWSCIQPEYPENPQAELKNQPLPEPTPIYITDFIKYVESNVNDSVTPGAAIAIVKDGKIILCKGFGLKEILTNDSVNSHTIFRIASVSKGFASILAGILIQEGKLNWDDYVIKYLPDFKLKDKKNTEKLTIRHILSQSTGLPQHAFTDMIEAKVPYAVLRDRLKEVNPIGAVGTVYSYQNVIYSLIADILEKVTGKTYEELLSEKIFGPLGMHDASASFNAFESSPNHAYPHVRSWKTLKKVKNTAEYYSVLPAAGVNASITDMALWLKALMGNNPDILHPEMLEEVFTPQIESTRKRSYHFAKWVKVKGTFYGLGWRVLNFGNDTLIYHGGFITGYRCEVAFDRMDKVGIVILSNGPGAFVNDAVPFFFNLFFENRDCNKLKTAGTNPNCLDDN